MGLLVGAVLFWITKQIGHNAIIVALAGGIITAILAKLFMSWEE
jgi:putative flippase GtrA